MKSRYLSYHQEKALETIKEGGKLLKFTDGTYALETCNNDSLKFRSTTFIALRYASLIESGGWLNTTTQFFILTKKGLILLNS